MLDDCIAARLANHIADDKYVHVTPFMTYFSCARGNFNQPVSVAIQSSRASCSSRGTFPFCASNAAPMAITSFSALNFPGSIIKPFPIRSDNHRHQSQHGNDQQGRYHLGSLQPDGEFEGPDSIIVPAVNVEIEQLFGRRDNRQSRNKSSFFQSRNRRCDIDLRSNRQIAGEIWPDIFQTA